MIPNRRWALTELGDTYTISGLVPNKQYLVSANFYYMNMQTTAEVGLINKDNNNLIATYTPHGVGLEGMFVMGQTTANSNGELRLRRYYSGDVISSTGSMFGTGIVIVEPM